jgi:hypothetical protein
MNIIDLTVNISYRIIADIDNCMVAAYYVNGNMVSIVSGQSDEIYEKIREVFFIWS